jgi:protein SCO1/2
MRHQVRLPIEDFSLIDQASGSFKFQALRGKVVLVTFMYTTCPDVCPLLTANMRVLQERLTATERKATFLLSITTDPEVDTPNVLKSYAERYKVDFSNWSFLSGDQKSLERVWKMFGVKVERKARGLVNHTTLTGVVDQKGIMRLAYSDAAPDPKKILHDVRSLLGPP